MIFSNISRYNGPFNPLFYARQALRQLWALSVKANALRTGVYPPFEEDALPTYMIPRA